MIRYAGQAIAFQEVPGETSLCLNITNCQGCCDRCHSPELRLDEGRPLRDDIGPMLRRIANLITCVCFLGEGADYPALQDLLKTVKEAGLKTCLYSGQDTLCESLASLLPYLDYLKLGSYRHELGGLRTATTNQRFFEVCEGMLVDKTFLFNGSEPLASKSNEREMNCQ